MSKYAQRKVRIRKTDLLRAMLTETLPYEVPMLFSNEGFYQGLKENELADFDKRHDLSIFDSGPTIPYKYKIKKNAYEFRGLSVMHPAQQQRISEFYQTYDHLIVGLCQRSPFTLRAPSAIASYFVERMRASKAVPFAEKNVEQSTSGFDASSTVATSYFAYSKYSFMFRFYDSIEFVELEKKFSRLSKLDISDCFNRIYTHTIAWAVKSKAHAKKNKSANSFEREFDQLMQNANHGETAGIIIGPEVSRIFAEIILQRIDLDILKKASEIGLEESLHYSIRRYVDDYFIYTNSEIACNDLKRIVSDCLSEYKLATNSSKTLDQTRPFITGPSISRHNISSNIKEFFDKHRIIERKTDDDGVISYQATIRSINSDRAANQTIAAIKRSIGENGSYDASANYFFGTVKKLLNGLSGKAMVCESENVGERIYKFLAALIEVVFFYYSMTPRVRQTYLTSEIILMVTKLMAGAPSDLKDSLIRKIVHEARLVITQGSVDRSTYKVEVMNLLIVLRGFGEKHVLDEKALLQIFSIENVTGKGHTFGAAFDYFQVVFLCSYLGNISEHEPIIRAAVAHCINRFVDRDWSQKAEFVFMLFDLMSCPHVLSAEKIKLAKIVLQHKSTKDINARATALIADLEKRNWFFGWGDEADLALVLKKKELRTPY